MPIQFKKNIIRIGVVSDTHIPISAAALPKAVIRGLKKVDLIIHAGDLITLATLKELERIAPVYAVCGNMDTNQVRKALPKKLEFKVSRFKIGVMHGGGSTVDLHLRMRREFENVDIIIFGHSHKPFKQNVEGVLMFNPGSATDKIFTAVNTFGILELNEKIKAEHIQV